MGKVENYSVYSLQMKLSRQWYGSSSRTGEQENRLRADYSTLCSRSKKEVQTEERRWARDGHGSEKEDWSKLLPFSPSSFFPFSLPFFSQKVETDRARCGLCHPLNEM